MESKTRPGGSGFAVLTVVDGSKTGLRLAYLQDRGQGLYNFFEFVDRDLWIDVLTATDGHVEAALRVGFASGELGLCKLIKSPSGVIRSKVYDMLNVTLVREGEEDKVWEGLTFPQSIRIHGPEKDQYNAWPIPVAAVVQQPPKENAQP